jgi:hypothetical protein
MAAVAVFCALVAGLLVTASHGLSEENCLGEENGEAVAEEEAAALAVPLLQTGMMQAQPSASASLLSGSFAGAGLSLLQARPAVKPSAGLLSANAACATADDLDCIQYDDVMDEFDEVSVRRTLMNIQFKSKPAAKHRSRPMLWIHIHKNAGSTMCALAAKNGERVITPHSNCNWIGHDQWSLTYKHKLTSCETRRQAFHARGATWGQIERDIQSHDFCEGFEYGIMLRDPLDHAVSMTRFDDVDIRQHVACLRNSSCKGVAFHVYDNFLIRMMLGKTGMLIEPGRVTLEHATRVIKLIEKFDVVATLNNFQDTLPAKLGWQHIDLHEKHFGGDNRVSAEDLQFIFDNTMMDRAVFEHFGGPKKYGV